MMKAEHLKAHPEILLSPDARLRDAIEALTKSQIGIALVVGAERRLLGILVDSDIRRALLHGHAMDAPVTAVMNRKPFTLEAGLGEREIAAAFRRKRRAYIPIVDRRGRVVDLAGVAEYLEGAPRRENWTVIMAGGLGRRLRPYTEHIPKPMIPIGDKPILELTLERLLAAGLNRFIFSLNYLGERIESHFQDGSAWGARIEYVRESRELGTAGALALIARKLDQPFLVMNADVLTKVNYRALLEFHESEGNAATLCVREYDFQVPYGVIQMKARKLAQIIEKPVHRFFVNAGIYVLEPATLRWLKRGAARDMPDFLDEIRRRRPGRVGCFPIQEYWLDIGKVEDYKRALQEYDEQFLA